LSTGEYGFPKGHAEPEDATPLDAAKRELLEETGVIPANLLFDPFTAFFESSYTNPRTGKQKVVCVWAAEIDDSYEVIIQPEEIASYRFVDIDQVKDVLSFKEDREHVDRLMPLLLDKRDRRNSKSEKYPQIVLFGDSLTAWSWKTGGLGQRLAHQYQRRADIVNRGFSGYNCTF
jgi:ADP-ribose pyrophosphatase YjhB (NUDIX family)